MHPSSFVWETETWLPLAAVRKLGRVPSSFVLIVKNGHKQHNVSWSGPNSLNYGIPVRNLLESIIAPL